MVAHEVLLDHVFASILLCLEVVWLFFRQVTKPPDVSLVRRRADLPLDVAMMLAKT